MELDRSISVCILLFIACTTALSSSTLRTLGSVVSSTAAGDSCRTVATSAPIPSITNHEPCILASSAVASFSSLSPSAPFPTIPAEIAYNCLKSVPIVREDALRIVTNLAPYFEFQSTIGFLKNPPSGYLLPGVDLMGGLARIESLVRADSYPSEYDYELDLYTLVLYAHDEHFDYDPDIFTGVFEFVRTQSLVSISKNGLELPEIYLLEDLRQSENDSYLPSQVISIDGKDAVTFLQDLAFGVVRKQDPDAAYNSLFSSIADRSAKITSPFLASPLYPGANTTFLFKNGTTNSFPNYAVSLRDLKGIRSGKDLYTKVVNGTTSSSASTHSETPLPTGYPIPIVKHSSNLISGFFLEGDPYKDVAVLSVPSFNNMVNAEVQEFQRLLQDFLAKAKKSKKTKLIIDVQANDGGSISLGSELFAQLFPSVLSYGGHNFRATKVNEVLGQIVSSLDESSKAYELDLNLTSKFNSTIARLNSTIAASPYNYRQDVRPDGSTTYGSWSEVFGPVVTSNDNFTNIVRWNYSDPLWDDTVGLVITGTGSRADFAQPFAAKDIVILSDGYCASTCALFSEFMKTQAGVPTIVVGGRPQYGPMQGVGGVKGALVQTFVPFLTAVELAYLQASRELQAQLNDTSLGNFSIYPANRSTSSHFNFFNNIREGDASFTPLQFVYEAADCRFFNTAKMLANITSIWTHAANIAFGNSSSPRHDWAHNPYCVRGSTNHLSSVSGGGPNNTDYADSAPPAEASSQARLPLLSDGTQMGWRLNLPTVATRIIY